ncbi:MAG: hypothetical protein MJZ51_05630 [Bacteroidales bacterium]|nr:hypothetical protein [Bacteroidales bacterium]
MKKAFRLAAIAIVAMAMTTACGGNAEEVTVDSLPVEDTTPVEVVDTTAVEEVVEEVVAETPAKKTTTKKEEKKAPKAEITIDPTNTQKSAEGLTIKSGDAKINIQKGGKVSVDTKNINADSKSGTLTIKK